MEELFGQWLQRTIGVGLPSDLTARIIGVILIAILYPILYPISRRFIFTLLDHILDWIVKDDLELYERKVAKCLSLFLSVCVLYATLPFILNGFNTATQITKDITLIALTVIGILVVNSLLDMFLKVYSFSDSSDDIPLTGTVQVAKILIYFVSTVFIISIILNKTPLYLLSGLGALGAVLLLVFKDAILGFVAGIQLIANQMVAKGDWIEMPKYGADGDVTEIALTTVKVQNWDKTITTIPTYALIGESFKNWRGMKEAGGRRIKRIINIDLSTIKFCDEEMLNRFSKIKHIAEYIQFKKEELAAYNTEHEIDNTNLANGRRMTNVGTFRAYTVAYLKNRPMVSQDMTFLVRHLAPTEHGLPIEVYVFCTDTVWANYEGIQADIFDHLLAVVPEFDLKVFQSPSGTDFHQLINEH